MPYNAQELSRLLMEIRRPFQRRDILLDRRRDVRYGRLAPWLPEEIKLFPNEAVRFIDRLPSFMVRRLKQRLGANALNISVRGRGDTGPAMQRKLEKLEDWLRGAMAELDPLGLKDGLVREHQVQDGLGILELELEKPFTPPLRRQEESDEDYDERVNKARRDYSLPICLNAPDPRSIYYARSGDRLAIVCKVVNVPLYQVMDAWTDQGVRVRYRGENQGLLDLEGVMGDELAPAPTAAEYGRLVRFVLIADDKHIYHCLFPRSITSTAGAHGDDAFGMGPGVIPSLLLLGVYPNLFNHPPFYFAGAGYSDDPDPAYHYEPLAVEVLDLAPSINQLRTIRMMRAFMDALKPIGIRRNLPDSENDQPPATPAMWRPGFMELPMGMEFAEIPTPHIPDFDKMESWLTHYEQTFNQSLMGAVQAGAIGRSTPAWTSMMFSEEQVGMLREALDSRAAAWQSLLLDVIECMRVKYLQDGPVYVRSQRPQPRQVAAGRPDLVVGLQVDDLDIPFRLEVSVEALTQSQRAADTEYWRRLREEGTLSRETYEERIGLADRVMEAQRRDRERLQAQVGDPVLLAREVARRHLRPLYGDLVDIILGPPPTQKAPPPPAPPAMSAPPEPEEGEGTPLPPTAEERLPLLPGQGISIMQPGPPIRSGAYPVG